jgi:hypothetical protein
MMDLRNSSWMALVGAAIGGAVGYFLFFWIAKLGFYGLMIPGAMLGLGAGMFRNRSIAVAVICGLAALILGLFTEWKFRPFIKDEGLGFFVANILNLSPVTLVMIVLGGVVGFWCPFPRAWDRATRGAE